MDEVEFFLPFSKSLGPYRVSGMCCYTSTSKCDKIQNHCTLLATHLPLSTHHHTNLAIDFTQILGKFAKLTCK
jgi:hypothetical protein